MRLRFVAELTRPGPWMFASFWALESLARSIVAPVVPVAAYDLLGESDLNMTFMFVIVGIVSIASAFAIPFVVHRLKPVRTYQFGAVLVALAPLIMAIGTFTTVFGGLFMRVFAANCLAVGLSLFIMAYIRKRDMGRSEPIRVLMASVPWAIGPTLGLWLYENMGLSAPFLVSAFVALALIAYLAIVRIDETPILKAAPKKPANPLSFVPRYFRQPRLRLAYLLIFGRENWWWMIYLYLPVYAERNGLEVEVAGIDLPAGGLALSFCSGIQLAVPLWGRLMRRIGMRRHMIGGMIITGIIIISAGLTFGDPWMVMGLILLSSVSMTSMEAAGNTPFLRAVRSRERTEMSMVYGTFRDMVGLVVPTCYTLILIFFELDAVFIASGCAMFIYAWYARYLPRSM
ncbi:MAG: MFS transporter [Alphaproteobacteria bacterium]|jgi:MFS family permease|nr:MFS transporter [Rhodospirillaceae bacterium]MDG2479733.1 MFS transporter [Alphaproteobacteria bacterium]MBT6205630.1 MFS transporter [Rhodospirillaceae bacterium]MBT6510080.1 MFS transporter [Rhodospirillaceae bacterium]MBT7612959.1 MFS transporter [Rhodospirillaceae bacterium]